MLDKDVCPETRWVEGSNYVDVNFKIDKRTNRIIMMGAMDNLVKGAAGQAVQNMNLMFGLKEYYCLPILMMNLLVSWILKWKKNLAKIIYAD